jgi:hypothetical protein
MIFSSQPALRHFAVLSLEKRRTYGTFWLVKDRRGLGQKQYLLVPNRARAWPLLLSSLSDLNAGPIRLRNGKVALLVSNSDLELIHNSIQNTGRTSTQRLNAISGFESVESSSKKKALIAIFGFAVIAAFVSVVPKPVVADVSVVEISQKPKPVVKCGIPIQVDSEIVGQIGKYKSIKLGGFEYKIAQAQKLGGLIQLKIKRNCDQKYFRVDAWSQSNQVTISKVY